MRHSYTIGPICGYGATKTAAREEAEQIAARLASAVDAWAPWFLPTPTCCTIWSAIGVMPTRSGYWSTWRVARDGSRSCIESEIESDREARYKIVMHAAQHCVNADTTPEDLDAVYRWLCMALDVSQAVVEMPGLRRQIRQQRAFRAAKEAGATDTHAHRVMCETL